MKKVLFFSLLCLGFLLVGCNIGQIEDTNGESDFTIETISDKKIISRSSSNFIANSVTNKIGSNTSIKVGKFSGVKELETTRVSNQTLTYEIESNCTYGNFRIVIVHNSEIIRDVAINSSEIITINNANGTYYLKIVGESAKFSLDYSIQKD